jgi:hypothetical protein
MRGHGGVLLLLSLLPLSHHRHVVTDRAAGVGAHYALHGKHTVLGAVAGCAVGHHMAVVAKRKKAEQKKDAAMAAHGEPVPAHH